MSMIATNLSACTQDNSVSSKFAARCPSKPKHKRRDWNPSRFELRDGTYDRLQGDPFIQLFLFQSAMMNAEAAKLAI